MKRYFLLIALLISAVMMTPSAWAQLSGAKTIDPAGSGADNFTTFKQAVDALNASGVGAGGVTFTVASGTYNETAALVINPVTAKPAAGSEVKFAVKPGASVILNVATANNQYAISVGDTSAGADYVTLDGSNGAGRGLTINATAADSSQGVVVYGDHCQIKNLVVTLSTPWNAVSRGIVLHQKFSADYCTVDNCDVTANYGIVVGTTGGLTQTGNTINGNTVHCLTQGIAANQSGDIIITNNEVIGNSTIYPLNTVTGIIASNSATVGGSVIIDNNKVHDLGTNTGTTAAVTVTGITGGSKGAAVSITRNRVYSLYNATSNSATPGTQVQGITLNNGDQTTMFDVSNNFVYGLEDNDPDVGSNWTAGIRPVTSGKIYVTHNTVFIKHTTRNHYTAAFICGGGLDLKDTNFVYSNLFYVDQAGISSSLKSYCIYKGTSYKGSMASDYNLLDNYGNSAYSGISNVGLTLPLWQAAGFDKHSLAKPVVFADSVLDLHLAGASVGDADLTGTPIPWVTNDIDGANRNVKYPYMGADEAATPLAAIVASSASVDFGDVVKDSSVVKSVYLKSSTKNAVAIASVSAPASDFTWQVVTPDTVTATDSLELQITFKPHTSGSYSAKVTVVTDLGSIDIALKGTSPAVTLAGSYTIDSSAATSGTNFKSFADAVAAINQAGISAPVTFTIAAGTYNEASRLVINPLAGKPTAENTITFAVKSGAQPVLNIAAPNNQYAITVGDTANSVDYVTIDGSNGAGRGLKVNVTAADSSKGVVVYGDHVQIKNLVLTLSTPLSPAAYGIVLHQTKSSDYCTVDNCDVTANYGILVGTSTGSTQIGNVISGNTVHFRTRGIQAAQSSDIQILNNEVIGDTTAYPLVAPMGINVANTVTTTGSVMIDGNKVHDMGSNRGTTGALIVTGINAGSKGTTYSITRNKIYNFWNASTATTPTTGTLEVMGINLTSGDSLSMYDVSNNIIYGFHDNDPVALTNKFTAGIRSQSPGKSYVYSNTVFIENTTRNHSTMAFAAGTSAYSDTFFVYNNIFNVDQTGQSSTARSYCIYKGGTFNGYLVSDYNVLMNNGTGTNSYIGQPGGTTFTTWKANGTAKLFHPDAHSANKSVVFVDSTSDYHLAGASLGDADLTGIPTPWVYTDFDGDLRNEKYPYIGADEASVPLAGILVSAASVDFGATATAGDSLGTTVYIKSKTKNAITVSSVSAPKSAFAWTYTVPATVADSSALVISFKPRAAGTFNDTVAVVSDFGSVRIAVTGKAKAAPRALFVDDFTGTAGTALTAAGWQQSGTSATNPVSITADGLSFGRYSGSGVGNAVTLAATGQDVYTTVGPYDTGSVYLTFMANVKTVGTGDYFIALSPSAVQTNYYARLHVKASGSGYVVGISKNNEVSGGAQYGTTVLPLNATVLFVVKYSFVPASAPADTTNDPIQVYAFTTTVPATEPATPEVSGYTTSAKVDAPDLGFVTLRQGGGSTSAPTLVIDGIRVGTSWAVSVPTEVKVQSADVPRVFVLQQNYPNPFNPSTKINFSVENDGYTTLRVFNILGQQVETVFSGMAQAGKMYNATFNASRLPSGIYFARLESGSKVSIRKMMLMK